jgi:signal transduction histidine kinase
VPVVSRGDVLGVLVGHFFTPHDFEDREIRLLSTLADQAAIALEHARHYEAVRAQQTQLAQILDSTSDGILLVGRDGRIQAANRRAGELLEFDCAEVLGRELAELIAGRGPDAGQDRSFAALRAVIDEPEREAQGDIAVVGLGRILHWVSRPTAISEGSTPDTLASPAARLANRAPGLPHGLAGTAVGLTLTFQDVTHEREVSQMKSDFVSFVTHQLRTPLSGIKWMLELAAEEPLAGEAGSYIQDARDAAQRLIELVNDLLDVSRLEQGRLTVAAQDVSLGELTRSVLDEAAVLIREKGHRLSVTGVEDVPSVTADPQLLRQVVLNLVSNAIKYTPAGGAITIEMKGAGDEVRWAIRDSGIGVPKQAQARLFEKFFRADNVATVETEGTGLGLYLVRLIMERCGGRVWCESEVGEGATFQFTLPLSGV